MSDFILIYNSNFILCTDRARICFKCYIEKERKCSFENALVEKRVLRVLSDELYSRLQCISKTKMGKALTTNC